MNWMEQKKTKAFIKNYEIMKFFNVIFCNKKTLNLHFGN